MQEVYICAIIRTMRVSQLARKLGVLPADVLAALPEGAIQAEGAYNARLTPAQVEEVVRFFRPDQWEKFLDDLNTSPQEAEATPEKEISRSATTPDIQPVLPANAETHEALSSEQPAEQMQEVEVIRAPKVELPGLRVLGKIEIPEKKKPEILIKPEQQKEQHLQPERASGTRKQDSRSKKNPIALARERARREAERQRKKEAELEKQRKTNRYLKKIAERKARLEQRAHAKASRQKTETANQNPLPSEVPSRQLTWWQRFKKWLFRE